MKLSYVLIAVTMFTANGYAQELQVFGPRAAIGTISDVRVADMTKGVHSAFGWEIEIPYKSGDFTGYGAAGVMLLAIEQGKFLPHVWGYFGCRYKTIGGGLGPVINPIGVGLGLNVYHSFFTETLRIPVGFDFNFIRNSTRVAFFIGFNYK